MPAQPDSADELTLFAHTWGLDHAALTQDEPWPRYTVEPATAPGAAAFDGRPAGLHLIGLGKFGNRFYQLLNAVMIARRLGVTEIRVDAREALGALPRTLRGIRFVVDRAGEPRQAAVRGVFFSYRGFERLIEPLDPWFIADTIEHWVEPLFPALPAGSGGAPALEDTVMAMHFRGGDVFTAGAGWVPNHYVMPPASFYTSAFDHARAHLGVTSARIVYQDRSNPALEIVEQHFSRHGIPYVSASGSLEQDTATLRGARHLAIPYGTFGESMALLSSRLRSLFSFRTLESHEWLYQRPRSLVQTVLRDARAVRTFVTEDTGGYIAPFEWRCTPEQLALLRDYPAKALNIREVGGP